MAYKEEGFHGGKIWILGIGDWVLGIGFFQEVVYFLKKSDMEKIKRLEDLEIYGLALEIGDFVWNIVNNWEPFAKRTVGEQFVDAADSIAANIAEGYGRYFYKDRKLFCYYSRGSLQETKNWVSKSYKRNLLTHSDYENLMQQLMELHHKLNAYIQKLNAQAIQEKQKLPNT